MREKSTILVNKETRKKLSEIGKKNQTYDQLIQELINLKNNMDLPDRQFQGYNQSNP